MDNTTEVKFYALLKASLPTAPKVDGAFYFCKDTDEMYIYEGSVESGSFHYLGKQPDWNQNDETEGNYIKNRICYEGETETNVYDILEADMGSGSLIGQDPQYSNCYFFDFPEGFAPKQGVTYTLHANDKEFVVTWNWNSFPLPVSGYSGGGSIYLNSVPSAEYASYKYYISLSFDGSYYAGSKLTWTESTTLQNIKTVDPKFLPEGVGYDMEPIDIVGNALTWDTNGNMEGTTSGKYFFNPTEPISPDGEYSLYFPKDDIYIDFTQGGTEESGSGGGSFGQGGGSFFWNINGLSDAPNGETVAISFSGNPYFFKNENAYFIRNTTHKIPIEYTMAAGKKVGNRSEIFNDYTHNVASGQGSHAEGGSTTAGGDYSHAEGYGTSSSGDYSHTEGNGTKAIGDNSHAEGFYTTAIGTSSHVEGSNVVAFGLNSHAEGHNSVAGGDYSHAEGYCTGTAYVRNVTKEDSTTLFTTSTINNIYVGSIITYASKYYKVTNVQYNSGTRLTVTPSIPDEDAASTLYYYRYAAMGNYSHIEGYNATAGGNYSHAEGQTTKASGESSHAEGYETTASGPNSHAEGAQNTASGFNSHAEGGSTTASGSNSHAEGFGTVASVKSQHVFGEYNNVDPSPVSSVQRGTYVEIVGNGTGTATRSNARTLDWNGNEVLAGNITINGDMIIQSNSGRPEYSNDGGVTWNPIGGGLQNLVDGDAIGSVHGTTSSSTGNYSMAEGNETFSLGENSHAEGQGTIALGENSHAEGYGYYFSNPSETKSLSYVSTNVYKTQGDWTRFNVGYCIVYEGYAYKILSAIKSGSYTNITVNSTNLPPLPSSSISVKFCTYAGSSSHSEGHQTIASGIYSHSEGSSTKALGSNSHAGGYNTTASGDYSHTEGYNTTAMGNSSHAEGRYTISSSQSQHVFGEYNEDDNYKAGVPDWVAGTPYVVGDKVIYNNNLFQCKADNSSTYWNTSYWNNLGMKGNYIEIVGNGTSSSTRSNARTLDWEGNETIAGNLTVKGDSITVGGQQILPQVQSDWNENDVTSKSYILNRTHWEIPETVIMNKTFPAPGDTTVFFNLDTPLIAGELYTVAIQGLSSGFDTTEEIVATGDSDGAYLINSKGLEIGYSSTGFPSGYNAYYTGIGANYGEIVTIAKSGELHQLDEKYIPDTIARVGNIPTKTSDLINDGEGDSPLNPYVKTGDLVASQSDLDYIMGN